MEIADLAVIQDRNCHVPGAGVGHDLANFGADGGTVGYRLCGNRDRKAEGGEKHSQKRKSLLPRSHGGSPFQDRILTGSFFHESIPSGWLELRTRVWESSGSAFASMREIDGLKEAT